MFFPDHSTILKQNFIIDYNYTTYDIFSDILGNHSTFVPLSRMISLPRVVCERLSIMHYTFQLPDFLVQNSLSAPIQVYVGLNIPPSPNWTDLGTLGWVCLNYHHPSSSPKPLPPPPLKCRFVQILALWDYLGTRVWRLIAVFPKDAISLEFFLNAFTEFSEFSAKKFVITVKGLEPATQPPLV